MRHGVLFVEFLVHNLAILANTRWETQLEGFDCSSSSGVTGIPSFYYWTSQAARPIMAVGELLPC